MILVTGGAGFIGANFVHDWLAAHDEGIVNIDALTYAGNPQNLAQLPDEGRHIFIRGNLCDSALLETTLKKYRPRAILHFAAESHVDRSISGPAAFIQTNIAGTFNLLEAARQHWQTLPDEHRATFRFLHISTDEVFGSLDTQAPAFTEASQYQPNSPYSASKAASDHLVRAWHHTYGLPVLTTHCSNNYGPYQFPEKLIPLVINNALAGKPLPLYGDGKNVRDWLYVKDHCTALRQVLEDGTPGSTYNIGGWNEMPNIDIVQEICRLLDELSPDPAGPHARLITFIQDRPGHDRRYAVDARKIHTELGWQPAHTFASGIRDTVAWYLDHRAWTADILSGAYQNPAPSTAKNSSVTAELQS